MSCRDLFEVCELNRQEALHQFPAFGSNQTHRIGALAPQIPQQPWQPASSPTCCYQCSTLLAWALALSRSSSSSSHSVNHISRIKVSLRRTARAGHRRRASLPIPIRLRLKRRIQTRSSLLRRSLGPTSSETSQQLPHSHRLLVDRGPQLRHRASPRRQMARSAPLMRARLLRWDKARTAVRRTRRRCCLRCSSRWHQVRRARPRSPLNRLVRPVLRLRHDPLRTKSKHC